MGERRWNGLAEAARSCAVEIVLSGPPTMPSLFFPDDDETLSRGRRFCRALAEQGVLWHPMLNHFLSAAHGPAEVDETIEAARKAFATL